MLVNTNKYFPESAAGGSGGEIVGSSICGEEVLSSACGGRGWGTLFDPTTIMLPFFSSGR